MTVDGQTVFSVVDPKLWNASSVIFAEPQNIHCNCFNAWQSLSGFKWHLFAFYFFLVLPFKQDIYLNIF